MTAPATDPLVALESIRDMFDDAPGNSLMWTAMDIATAALASPAAAEMRAAGIMREALHDLMSLPVPWALASVEGQDAMNAARAALKTAKPTD